MLEIGIFYGSSDGATKKVARKLQQALGAERTMLHDVKDTKAKRALDYELIILGSPTYEKGKLQRDWDRFLDKLKKLDLGEKTAAVFALGDQGKYRKTFADALKPLHKRALKCGARMIGAWPVEGYEFKESAGVKQGRFLGLVIDDDRQRDLTDDRVNSWAEQLLGEWETRERDGGADPRGESLNLPR